MHITPQQAWESFPQAQSPTDPLDPDVIWQRVVDYNLAHNPLAQPPAKKNDPGEAGTSPKVETVRAITTPGTSHTDGPTIDPRDAAENYRFDVPVELEVNRHGTVAVCGYNLYIGLRFKSRKLFSIVTPR